MTDTVMTGHASATDLAAMGLGANIYGTVFMGLMGVMGALTPIIAQHYGANRERAIGASYVQGLWLALLLSVPGCVILGVPELWLPSIDADPAVKTLVWLMQAVALALASQLLLALYARVAGRTT